MTQPRNASPSSFRPKVLIIDDDPLQSALVAEVLEDLDLDIHTANDRATALLDVKTHRPQLVFLDLVIPGVVGMELLDTLLQLDASMDVILVTAYYSTDSAVEAIQKGAYDYLTKPLPIARLRQKVENWLAAARKRETAAMVETDMVSSFQFENMIGRSPLVQEVFSKIQRLAPHYSTALITGETGTGKELVARALHRLSPRADGALIVCNCAAISESLFEAELFGHVRGAFTGAVKDKTGFIEQANHATLFLDEIAEIPPQVQAKLLRVLQNREVQRVGADAVRHVDVRIIAATNRDLPGMVMEKTFREDIYYRFAMVEIHLPRLADRKEDITLLQRAFVEKFSRRYGKSMLRLTSRAELFLSLYSWPGNVRELENALDYACMMCQGTTIDIHDFPEKLRDQGSTMVETSEAPVIPLEAMERRYIMQVLERYKGNRREAAKALGISRSTLYRLLPTEHEDRD